jgi:pimeloyl-ACP methyl ester carboxylesterase
MPYVETQHGTRIFFKDWGEGKPIVFHHGWPLSSDDWDTQMLFFNAAFDQLLKRNTMMEKFDWRRSALAPRP